VKEKMMRMKMAMRRMMERTWMKKPRGSMA
jgi:hypothetical protein